MKKGLLFMAYSIFLIIAAYYIINADNGDYGVVSYFTGSSVVVENAGNGVLKVYSNFPEGICVGDTVYIEGTDTVIRMSTYKKRISDQRRAK